MVSYSLVFIIALFLSIKCTPLAIRISLNTGAIDNPFNDPLKIHHDLIPLLGGLPILIGIFASLLASLLFSAEARQIVGVLFACLLVHLLGLFDDFRKLSPGIRLLGQICAALIIISISQITVKTSPLWYISIPLTVFYLIAAINSVNLLDGIDGIAAGTTLVASVGFLAAFIIEKNTLGVLVSLALMGVTSGFLVFNFNPARIFLGDNGSTVLGLLMGILAVLLSSKAYSITRFLASLLILIVPIFDTGLAVGRRIVMHKSPFLGDRDHVYDKLMKIGYSQKKICLIAFSFGFLGALAAILVILKGNAF